MLDKCIFCNCSDLFVANTDEEGFELLECIYCRKVKYPDKFKPGDMAIAKKEDNFCDGTVHRKDQRIIVTELTVAYFNVNFMDYRKGN